MRGHENTGKFRTFIDRLLSQQGVTVEQAAQRCDLDASTIYRWRSGTALPRVEELERFVKRIGGDTDDIRYAATLLDAARFVGLVRDGTASTGEGFIPNWFPGAGDLWRSMRERRGIHIQQVVQHLRVASTSVYDWEASTASPPEDRLEEIFALYGAYPEEREVLRNRRLWLASPWEADAPLERYDERHHALNMLDGQPGVPADLCFLTLISGLWRRVRREPRARYLLALVYVSQFQFLLWQGRWKELGECVGHLQEVCEAFLDDRLGWLMGGWPHARYLATRPKQADCRQAIQWLETVQDLMTQPRQRCDLHRDLAEWTCNLGQHERALTEIDLAERAAHEADDPRPLMPVTTIRASVLIRSGRASEAVDLLAAVDAFPPGYRACALLTRANAYHWLGDRSSAQESLSAYFDLESRHNLHSLHREAEALAHQL